VFLFAADEEAEAQIEAQSRVNFHDVELDGLLRMGGFRDETAHDLGPDAVLLERGVDIKLAEEEGVRLRAPLEPANVLAVECDDADFPNFPLFGEFRFVRGTVELEGFEEPGIQLEIELLAEGVVRGDGGAEGDSHGDQGLAA